jgi:hypothetical protein
VRRGSKRRAGLPGRPVAITAAAGAVRADSVAAGADDEASSDMLEEAVTDAILGYLTKR